MIGTETWIRCPDCGVLVHPDPFYMRVHYEFYAINKHLKHVPWRER